VTNRPNQLTTFVAEACVTSICELLEIDPRGEIENDQADEIVTLLADNAPLIAEFWEYFNDNQNLTPFIAGSNSEVKSGNIVFAKAVANSHSDINANLAGRMFCQNVKTLASDWAEKTLGDWMVRRSFDPLADLLAAADHMIKARKEAA